MSKSQPKYTWHIRPARATLKDSVLTETEAKQRTRVKITFEIIRAATCSLPHSDPRERKKKKTLMLNNSVVKYTQRHRHKKTENECSG